MIIRITFLLITVAFTFSFAGCKGSEIEEEPSIVLNKTILNPYKGINWGKSHLHKASLHSHTLQSDGLHTVSKVVNAYKTAGYSILAITDHDWDYPNAAAGWGAPIDEISSFPLEPKPVNYPANTTWPWEDYGAPSPSQLDMVGIQSSELTFRHHILSFFSDYGVWYEKTGAEAPYGGIVDASGNEVWEDDQLLGVKELGGLAVLAHPGLPNTLAYWNRKPMDWYVDLFSKHNQNYLIGLEITNNPSALEKYDHGLWDQLLARFMPNRPIWGFAGDDMHNLKEKQDTYMVFPLEKLSSETVREAMEKGQFYLCKSSLTINMETDQQIDRFPKIQEIKVNESDGTIEIKATNFDVIRWISAPASQDPIANYENSNQPWPLGTTVHEGAKLDLRKNPRIRHYVRAELSRKFGGHTYRVFTNPFGVN